MQTEEDEAALVERMKSILAPFVIRRLKTEVADQLPCKTHKVLPQRLLSKFPFPALPAHV